MRSWKYCSMAMAAIATLSLSACGGGGGGGGESAPAPTPPKPSYILSLKVFAVQAAINEPQPREVVVPIRLASMPDQYTIYGRLWATSSEVFTDANFRFEPSGLQLVISLKHPSGVVPNIYQSTVEMDLCLDFDCDQPLVGNTSTFDITYTVTRPTGALAPRVSASTTSFNAATLYFSSQTKRFESTLSFQNVVFQPILKTTTTNGIQRAGTSDINPHVSTFGVELKSGRDVGSGAHAESVVLQACFDSDCVNELDGSPITFNVGYNVGDELTLANGHTLRATAIDHNETVWDPHSQRFYFLIPANDTNDPDMVGSYDPLTRMKSAPVPVGRAARGLAISDDGQFLYVGSFFLESVQRLSLPSLTPALTIPLGMTPDGSWPLYPRAIGVIPGSPHSIVVATSTTGAAGTGDLVAVYDDSVRRPAMVLTTSTGEPWVDAMCFGPTDGKLYGVRTTRSLPLGMGDTAIYELTITPSGVHYDEGTQNFGYRESFDIKRRLHCAPTRVYSADSFVFDPADNSVFMRFPQRLDSPNTITVDVGRNKIFGGGRVGFTINNFLRAYDLNSFGQLDELAIPIEIDSAYRTLTTWGTSGVAFEVSGNGPNSRAYGKHFVTIEGPMFAQ